MLSDQEFKQKITALYAKFKQHDAQQADRGSRYRNIEPESAQFLATLVRIQQSQRLLEIGTSTGHSTLWLAQSIVQSNAQIISLDIDSHRIQMARQYAQDFDLADKIDFRCEDALTFLNIADDDYDFILLDAERDAYVSYWFDLKRLLKRPNSVLIVDNVISHASELTSFHALILKDTEFQSQILEIGAGLMLITRQR